jgi:hypothetical protein
MNINESKANIPNPAKSTVNDSILCPSKSISFQNKWIDSGLFRVATLTPGCKQFAIAPVFDGG